MQDGDKADGTTRKGINTMDAPDKLNLKSLSEDMLDLVAGGAISDGNADRYRKLIGQVKAKGWSKDEFFAEFTEDYIAEIFTIRDTSTMGTPAEILQFYKDNWDDCPPIYE